MICYYFELFRENRTRRFARLEEYGYNRIRYPIVRYNVEGPFDSIEEVARYAVSGRLCGDQVDERRKGF